MNTSNNNLEDQKYLQYLKEKALSTYPVNINFFTELHEYEKASQRERILIRRDKTQKQVIYYSVKNNRITLKTNITEKGISFSGNPFLYLKNIITKNEQTLKKLQKIGSSKKNSNISGTIKRINERIKSKLTISKNLIENNKSGAGYCLNKAYDFKIE